MPSLTRSHRPVRIAVVGMVLILVATVLLVSPSSALLPPEERFQDGKYVVILKEQPAASARKSVLNSSGKSVSALRSYRARLVDHQKAVSQAVGATPTHQFTTAINGFAARLSADQAAELAQRDDVLAVTKDSIRHLDTVNSPEFLGLSGDNNLWDQLGGPEKAGHGVVIGMIDSGIDLTHPSFAGDALPQKPTREVGQPYRTSATKTAMIKADGETFTGECQASHKQIEEVCNDKVISARYFEDGFTSTVPDSEYGEHESISPIDGKGHGTLTASVAAGNTNVAMKVRGHDLGEGSGMAPAAKIASYKVCWEDKDPTTGGCFTSDIVSAIEQAIIDNVDVINLSISGTPAIVTDAVELALLSAATADIFVATSAGNDGPSPSTVAHNSPWVTTVAASTHNRYEGTVKLGNGQRFRGSMVGDARIEGQTRMVYAGNIPAADASESDAAQCHPDALDQAKAAGAIVFCDHSGKPPTEKSAAVTRAGGAGMILGNVEHNASTVAAAHVIPTVHLAAADAAQVRDYLQVVNPPKSSSPAPPPRRELLSTVGDSLTHTLDTLLHPISDDGADSGSATAALLPGDKTARTQTPLPVVGDLSARGPALSSGGDVLKPDITAPGVAVVAAVADGPANGEQFTLQSGTSIAAPHVAGLAAIIRGAKPEWSAMAVKSALMTTASDLKTADGSREDDWFNVGAGHVNPADFLDPGIRYESAPEDWMRFLAGSGEVAAADGAQPLDPSNLNQASIAVGSLAGSQKITRHITADKPGRYTADVDLPGFSTDVEPRTLNFEEAGATKRVTITITRTTAPMDTYTHGSLTWRGEGVSARSPIVVKPVELSAPAEVSGSGASGRITYNVTPESSGEISVTPGGLTPGVVTTGHLKPGQSPNPRGNGSSQAVTFTVPKGTQLARFDLRSAAETADYDLYVYGPDGEEIPAHGATIATDEKVDLPNPKPGTYTLLVHAYSSSGPQKTSFELRSFAVRPGSDENLNVTRNPVQGERGKPTPVAVEYSGLDKRRPYLGTINYDGAENFTIISIN